MDWFDSDISLPITQRARKVIGITKREARKLRASEPLSEHLLLAVLMEGGGVAAKVLKNLGVTPGGSIRRLLKSGVAADRRHDEPLGRCMERSEGAALRLGHTTIGTEHILIGILEASNSRAYVFLKELSIDVQGISQSLIKVIAAPRRS